MGSLEQSSSSPDANPAPVAASSPSEPALDAPGPAGPATLDKSDIAQLLGVAKARESSTMAAVALPAAEEKAPRGEDPVAAAAAAAGTEPTTESGAGADPDAEESLAQKKQLIAQMLRDRKTNPAMAVSAERAREPLASPSPNEPAPVAREAQAPAEKPRAVVATEAGEAAATAEADSLEAAFGSSRQRRRRAGAIAVAIGLAVAAKLALSSMAGPSHASGHELAARAPQPSPEAAPAEAAPAALPPAPAPEAPPSGPVLTRARLAASNGGDSPGPGTGANSSPSSTPSPAPRAAVSMAGSPKPTPLSGGSGEVWKGIVAKKGGKSFGEVLRHMDGLDPATLLPKSPPLLGPKSQPIEAPAPTSPNPQ